MGLFRYNRIIRLQETDATGVLYFAEQLKIALEAFEDFLIHKGFSLNQLIESPYLMPVVHAEADYFAPLKVGDRVNISVALHRLGEKSFTLHYVFHDPVRAIDVGTVTLIHVTVDGKTRSSLPIPESILLLLHEIDA